MAALIRALRVARHFVEPRSLAAGTRQNPKSALARAVQPGAKPLMPVFGLTAFGVRSIVPTTHRRTSDRPTADRRPYGIHGPSADHGLVKPDLRGGRGAAAVCGSRCSGHAVAILQRAGQAEDIKPFLFMRERRPLSGSHRRCEPAGLRQKAADGLHIGWGP